jgi:anaerobic selenocysteine-containing dehydrogenase
VGTTAQAFGTVASWLVDVINVLTGNLDREGGAMFPLAAAGQRNSTGTPRRGSGIRWGRWHSRVRGLPEAFGELPAACLAEEIDTPGEGQVRALITLAGNPVLSTPNGGRLEAALGSLELLVSIDIYVNETTRHADVILPAPDPLAKEHYDLALYQLAARNVANFSPPVLPLEDGAMEEWKIMLRLMGIAAGQGPDADVELLDRLVIETAVRREVTVSGSPVEGRAPEDLIEALEPRRGPERMLDFLLRVGAYGDGFGARPGGLTLDQLTEHPHGIDLGALRPRIPEMLRTPSGKIELAPEPVVADVERVRSRLDAETNGGMVLIGRRDLRSNNSWMHNLEALVKGPERCTVQVHPHDAERLGLVSGGRARLRSAAGELDAPVEITEAIMPGVVSIPHGWGHSAPGSRLQVAARHAGVNTNLVSDDSQVDLPSGNAVLNGIPVEIEPAAPAGAVRSGDAVSRVP